jgi:hypothetical protein
MLTVIGANAGTLLICEVPLGSRRREHLLTPLEELAGSPRSRASWRRAGELTGNDALPTGLREAYDPPMTSGAKKNPVKAAADRRKATDGVVVMVAPEGRRKGRVAVFSFGSATVKVPVRDEEWADNIALSQVAMKKLAKTLLKPGVKLRTSKDVPLFRSDPDQPGQLIRVLDGKEERGVFVDGQFKIRR